jgi:hypothetical protein
VSGRVSRRWWVGAAVGAAAGALLVLVAIVATGDADGTDPVETPTSTTAPPSSSSPATADGLTITLGRVDGRRVDGGLPGDGAGDR